MEEQNTQYNHYSLITADHKLLDLKLREVWQYRDLIWLFTKRSFAITYKQTVLGPAWIFLNPLISSVIYAFVFGGIAGIGTDGVPQLLFYLAGNAIWTLFSSSITKNASTFTSNAAVFGKVYFPRLTMPISNVLSSIIQFGVQLLLVLVLLAYYLIRGDVHPVWSCWLLIPAVLIQLGLMGFGFGLIISSLTTKYRDLAILVTFGVQLWMYVTPVVYPISQLGEGLARTAILINPVTAPVELFKFALLGSGSVMPMNLLYSWIVTVVVAVIGIMIFNKVERTFMDTV